MAAPWLDMKALHRLAVLALFVSPALAQGFNVDVGSPSHATPSTSYGAAAGQGGTWNTFGDPWSSGLFDIQGNPSGVVLTSPGPAAGGGGELVFDNSGTFGDDGALIDDAMDTGPANSGTHFAFSGLVDGNYEVYTYAIAPDGANFRTSVEVIGSPDPEQLVGGDWSGSHVQGVSYARHLVTVVGGSDIVVRIRATFGFGSVNGFQLVPEPSLGTNYCVGAQNSFGTSASIFASGSLTVADQNLTLTTTGVVPSVFGIYFFGTTQIQAPFGDGFRCTGGAVMRVQPAVPVNATGVATRTINFNAPYANPITPGADLNFQFWYRDVPAGMTGFNLSDARALSFQ